MAYAIGQQVQLQARFVDQTGAAADPTAVTLFVKPPPGNAAVAQHAWPSGGVSRSSIGVFTYNVSLGTPGTWTYAWEGTGVVQTATFDVPLVVSASAIRAT